MSTTAISPSNLPPGRNSTANALLALVQDPGQVRDWLSVTPNWLRAALGAIVLLSAVFAVAIRRAADEQFQTIHTIQVDSAPSVVAGQRMRASLADMHSNLANELLVEPEKESEQAIELNDAAPGIKGAPEEPLSVEDLLQNLLAESSGTQAVDALKDSALTIFKKRRSEAARFLVAAARNITYHGEVPPVWTVVNELARYEERAGRARVMRDHHVDAQSVAEQQRADDIMRTKLLPAVEMLIKVNQDALDDAYKADRTAALVNGLLVFLTGAALLAALIGLKFLLFRRMRRVVNPPLLIAALLAAAGCLWALVGLWQSSADIRKAKEDAFDSIKVLETARATAYDANGDESRYLLVKFHGGTADQVEFYADAFHRKAKEIVGHPGPWNDEELRTEIQRTRKVFAARKGFSADDLKNDQAVGTRLAAGLAPEACLAKELGNITFDGELDKAKDALLTFLDYLKIDQQIRDLAARNEQKQAVELCVGTQSGQSDWTFDQFDQALRKTIAINRKEFDKSLRGAAGWLAGLDWLLPLGLALAVSLLTFLGLRPRLNEYAIQ
ncbi:MAG: hypothetical protein ACLP9L_37180 [Thermoguttaceae bacterium]